VTACVAGLEEPCGGLVTSFVKALVVRCNCVNQGNVLLYHVLFSCKPARIGGVLGIPQKPRRQGKAQYQDVIRPSIAMGGMMCRVLLRHLSLRSVKQNMGFAKKQGDRRTGRERKTFEKKHCGTPFASKMNRVDRLLCFCLVKFSTHSP